MDRIAQSAFRLAKEESGFTFMELLVSMSLAIVVLLAAALFSETAKRSQVRTTDRTESLRQQTAGVERITKEARQAVSLNFITSERVDFETYVRIAANGAKEKRRVLVDCSTGSECRRYIANASGTFPSTYTTLITGVENAEVFRSFQGTTETFVNPDYLEVKVRVNLRGQSQPITLSDGVDLRNDPL